MVSHNRSTGPAAQRFSELGIQTGSGQARIWLEIDGAETRRESLELYLDWGTRDGVLLAQHRTGEVTRIETEDSPFGVAVVRKSYRYPERRDRRRGWFRNTWMAPSRVRREARVLKELARRRLNPPLFLAFGEVRRFGVLWDSFLITRWIESEPFDRALARNHTPHLCEKLGSFVGNLHRAGLVDRDLHLRNLLVTPDGDLFKVDTPRGTFRALLAAGEQQRELSTLLAELDPLWSHDDRRNFETAYRRARYEGGASVAGPE